MRRVSLDVKDNGRSADFIIPNFAVGCKNGCSDTYCYVARHRKGNPLTIYDNIDEICEAVALHFSGLPKKVPSQTGDKWVYDIGEATDALLYDVLPTTNRVINNLLVERGLDLQLSFATKMGVPSILSKIDYNGPNLRIRQSLSPPYLIKLLERNTPRLEHRIEGLNYSVSRGWEAHINFSPIVLYKSWLEEYTHLFRLIDRSINDEVKKQLACEIIFLTHDKQLHEWNLEKENNAEHLLWQPPIQEDKINNRKDVVKRYNHILKGKALDMFKFNLTMSMDYCRIRYAF